MNKQKLNINKDLITYDGIAISIEIDGDSLLIIRLQNDNGSLFYDVIDNADLDGEYTIQGHIPEYFEMGEQNESSRI
jgi:hypothetical protein